MPKFRRMLPWLTLLLLFGLVGEALGCPNCKEAIANQNGDAMRLANGYSWSIILMLAMPFLLLAAGSMMVVRAVKRGSFPEL